jgi:lipoprotein LprG
MQTRSRRVTALAVAALLALALTSCSDDTSSATDGKSPEEVLAAAKQALDETSGLSLALTTDDLPDGVTGIEKASGVATRAPAFDGSITVVLNGQPFVVPVISVDGKVNVQLPLTPGWQDIDPAEYGAPDPAQLMSPDHGFSALLTATTDVEKGDSVRGGADNSEVLTEYTGSVPGDAVKVISPAASGDFDATYTVADDGELREAELTGVFYQDSDPMTYTVTFDDYGTEKDITAP